MLYSEVRRHRYIPPEKDFWKAYNLAEEHDQVMLLAYLHLAARRTELFRLKWDEVDFANQRVSLGTRKRKGGHLEYDSVPMTDELFNALLMHRKKATRSMSFLILKPTDPIGREGTT
jgi:integrase